MKHTMVRTALRNGAVFEIPYTSALDNTAKRNWWAAAREVVRVTKGKGLIVTGGCTETADLRAPKDVGNLYVNSAHSLIFKLIWDTRVTFLGLAQDEAHAAVTTTPKSLVLRARAFHFSRSLFFSVYLSIPQKPAEPIVPYFRSQEWLYQPPHLRSLLYQGMSWSAIIRVSRYWKGYSHHPMPWRRTDDKKSALGIA